MKGHVVHAAEHIIDSEAEENDPTVELNPLAALAFILTSSALLVTLYYIDIFSYVSIIYLFAAAYSVHVCCIEPFLFQLRRCICFVFFVYNWRRFPQDTSNFVQNVLCQECFDSLRSSNLPLMQVDREDAVYDEETGEILTDSSSNHNSRFYLDPHLARDIAERDARSRRERDGIRARRMDLPVPIRNFADSFDDAEDAESEIESSPAGVMSSCSGDVNTQIFATCQTPWPLPCTWPLYMISIALAITLPVLWYFFPTSPFRWLWQDVMGASVSIFFLKSVRVSSLKVATALLCCAFIYDIFFVFISLVSLWCKRHDVCGLRRLCR